MCLQENNQGFNKFLYTIMYGLLCCHISIFTLPLPMKKKEQNKIFHMEILSLPTEQSFHSGGTKSFHVITVKPMILLYFF